MAQGKKFDVWKSIPDLKEYLNTQFHAGYLQENSVTDLHKQVCEKFIDPLNGGKKKSEHIYLGIRNFRKILFDDIIWNKNALDSLGSMMANYPEGETAVDKFCDYHPYYPRKLVLEKRRELRGVSRTQPIEEGPTGVNVILTQGELSEQEYVSLEKTSLESPFNIPVQNKNAPRGKFVGGINFGFIYNPVIEENAFRRILESAELEKCDFLVLSGPILHLEVKATASATRVHRSRVSGETPNLDVIEDPEYRKKAKKLLEEGRTDELVYITLRERIRSLMNGMKKVALRKDGSPEYTGNIFFLLGVKDEEYLEEMASAMGRYTTMSNLPRLRAEVKMAKKAMLKAEIDGTEEDYRKARKKYEAIYNEEKRTRVNNIEQSLDRKIVRQIRSWFIRELESTIPNSKVLGMGTTYVRVGEHTINLVQWRNTGTTDNVLDRYVKEDAALSTLIESEPATVNILCPPFPIAHHWTVNESAKEGKRSTAIHTHVLPSFLDQKYVEKYLKSLIAARTPIERMFRKAHFVPGYLNYKCINGIPCIDPVRPEVLHKKSERRIRSKTSRGRSKDVPSSYIYLLIDTDPHWGNGHKVFCWDKGNKQWLGTTPALIELLRRDGMLDARKMPIHAFHLLDDGAHGNHFGAQKQPHQNAMPIWAIESWFKSVQEKAEKSGKPKIAIEALKEMFEQIQMRGEHRLEDQMKEYARRFVQPNLDFFISILKKNQKSKLVFRGPSHYYEMRHDRRDIGPITFGSGNHTEKTIDGHISEGFYYRDFLVGMLLGSTHLHKFSVDELQALIKNPLYGLTHIGWGTVGVGDSTEWGISLRSNPVARSGMGDPLKAAAKKLVARGNFTRFFEGKNVVDLSGDIHRYGRIEIPGAPGKMRSVINCASGTDTDSFGEIIGYSPNNTGNMIVGLPVDGASELRVIPITYDWLIKQFDNPSPVNWEDILPNPV